MSQLFWKKNSNHSSVLSNGTLDLVHLSFQENGKSIFSISNNKYHIELKGFWLPQYVITSNNNVILSVKHDFWGSSGTISFNDGTSYKCKYSGTTSRSLAFLSNEYELLTYQFNLNNGIIKIQLRIGTELIDADKLLILCTLGYVMYSNILSEGEMSDILTIIIN